MQVGGLTLRRRKVLFSPHKGLPSFQRPTGFNAMLRLRVQRFIPRAASGARLFAASGAAKAAPSLSRRGGKGPWRTWAFRGFSKSLRWPGLIFLFGRPEGTRIEVESLYELDSSPGDEYHVDGDRGRRHEGALWALPLLTVVDFHRPKHQSRRLDTCPTLRHFVD